MANEYLRRTPTTTGNRRVWTWSGWVKKLRTSAASDQMIFYAGDASTFTGIIFGGTDGDKLVSVNYISGGLNGSRGSSDILRDTSGWFNVLVSYNSTADIVEERIKLFVNGKRILNFSEQGNIGSNIFTTVNNLVQHNIGRRVNNQSNFFRGQFFDIFFVDGQALTPDVFGYYSKGKGYFSAGTARVTDIRKGQWVPKSPRVIKSVINATGGFGVNGFYLPMNDSSNYGADFHCDPNSIIKLKGEDLAQPRNGAPATTDNYVSQLRSDPFKDYLVLAVPGISTATGPNLITNGTFDSDTTGWTISNASHGTISVNSNRQLVLSQTTGGELGVLHAWQAFTTEVGKRYTVSVEIVGGTAASSAFYVNNSSSFGNAFGSLANNDGNGFKTLSFQATGTTTYILLRVNTTTSNVTSIFDNVVIRQEDSPRDYSANIKGSGTNKTLTGVGTGGVGYQIPSYYGSAVTFDGTGSRITIPSTSDLNFGTGDFTIEFWANFNSLSAALSDVFMGNTQAGGFGVYFANATPAFVAQNIAAVNAGINIVAGQWNHIVWERNNTLLTCYVNGAAALYTTFTSNLTQNGSSIGAQVAGANPSNGYIQDLRVYKGVAKYKGGFNVPKPYAPIGFTTNWRAVPDTIANNFATMNSLIEARASSGTNSPSNSSIITFADGNLNLSNSASAGNAQRMISFSTIGITSGKWYYEQIASTNSRVGICKGFQQQSYGGALGSGSGLECSVTYDAAGNISVANGASYSTATTLTPPSYTGSNIIGVSIDASQGENNLTVKFYRDGVEVSTLTGVSGTSPTREWFVLKSPASSGSGDQQIFNFGQNPTLSGFTSAGTFTDSNGKGLFKYQPPSGFLALCEDNLSTPAISDPGKHFRTVLYNGTGVNGTSVTGVGFKPDLVWIKNRDGSYWHVIGDSVRGPNRVLFSNNTNQENTSATAVGSTIQSFDNDGFTLAGDPDSNTNSGWNVAGGTRHVAWCWKAGDTTTTNTSGSITSTVSVNQTAGFSIVSWTGNGISNATVGHGLGKTPAFVISKARNGTNDWWVIHKAGAGNLQLNSTSALITSGGANGSLGYPNTLTSTTFTFTAGANTVSNANASTVNYITYCWAEIDGFSKFGSYIGNGSLDGPFIYCGFRPAFVMLKRIDAADHWAIMDSSRDSFNRDDNVILYPNLVNGDSGDGLGCDELANGFKVRGTATRYNGAGGVYIFVAFAESPFKYANSK